MAIPHPENVPGDFYVEDGCCITCGVPMSEAPGIFDWTTDGGHCAVKRQPQTADEILQTLGAITSTEIDCIRYRGRNAEIVQRISEMGEAHCIDHPPTLSIPPVNRDRVSFTVRSGPQPDASDLADRFERDLRERNETGETLRYTIRRQPPGGEKVEFAWFQDKFHAVRFEAIRSEPGFVAIVEPNLFVQGALRGLARRVDDWLRTSDCYADLRWYSAEQWRKGGPWRDTVI